MIIEKLNVNYTPTELFSFFQAEPYCFFLDSSLQVEGLSSYSFMGSSPFLIFTAKNGICKIISEKEVQEVKRNPFSVLSELHQRYSFKNTSPFPFVGGAVGYFSYDAAQYLEKLPSLATDDLAIPDMCFGFYDGILIIDHKKEEIYVSGSTEEIIKGIKTKLEAPLPISLEKNSDAEVLLTSTISHKEYLTKIQKVKEYILQGDIYEMNLTQRFSGCFPKDPFTVYQNLRKISPSPFGCYLSFEDVQLLSSSPERLLQIQGQRIETRPIKGTRPRGKTPQEDEKYKKSLLNSEKDQSELLMIIDLSRNDLSRICTPHSVKVTRLFGLESYSTVYHLVSTIEGHLKEGINVISAIKALFPGGSITGAPKIRSMEIIDELEPTKRSVYTGSIGYIGFDGSVDLNIAIRTMILKEQQVHFQVGGAITYDSNPQKEYEETLHKAQGMLRALGGTIYEG